MRLHFGRRRFLGTVGAAGGAVAGGLVGATLLSPKIQAKADGPSFIGAWNATAKFDTINGQVPPYPIPNELSVITIQVGGTLSISTNQAPSGQGAWTLATDGTDTKSKTGNTIALRVKEFNFDPRQSSNQNKYGWTGSVEFYLTATLSDDGNSFTGSAQGVRYDTSGNQTATVTTTVTATRLQPTPIS